MHFGDVIIGIEFQLNDTQSTNPIGFGSENKLIILLRCDLGKMYNLFQKVHFLTILHVL